MYMSYVCGRTVLYVTFCFSPFWCFDGGGRTNGVRFCTIGASYPSMSLKPRPRHCSGFSLIWPPGRAHVFHWLKNMCSPVGFKGNLPLLEICAFFSRGLKQMEDVVRFCFQAHCARLLQEAAGELFARAMSHLYKTWPYPTPPTTYRVADRLLKCLEAFRLEGNRGSGAQRRLSAASVTEGWSSVHVPCGSKSQAICQVCLSRMWF